MWLNSSPKNASTWLEIPFIALRKIWGSKSKQGCWCASKCSFLTEIFCKNSFVLLMTWGQHKAVGGPTILKNRYQDCATDSLVISAGIKWLSSSGIFNSGNDGPYMKSRRRAVNAKFIRFHLEAIFWFF